MNTSPRFDRRWWYGLPLALLALMLVFEPSALDFAFSDLFYVQGQGFIGRHNDFLEDVLHDRAKQLVIVIGVLAIAGDRKADFDEVFDYLRNPDGPVAIALEQFIGAGWFLAPPPIK